MFTNFKQILAIFGSFCSAMGPYIAAMATFHALWTPTGIGGALIVFGGWATALCTYSPKEFPIGSPLAGSK